MDALQSCSKCSSELIEGNRLITEECGHIKCRNCLISEQYGCIECFSNSSNSRNNYTNYSNTEKKEYNNPLNFSPSGDIKILEDVLIQPAIRNNKRKTKLRKFPKHITKEIIEGKLSYTCGICNKNFGSRSQQYYHIFCDDAKNKPYKCTECLKTFSSLYHLKYHSEEHKGRTIKCEFCDKVFSKLNILRKHTLLHSKPKKKCLECDIEYKDERSFKSHLEKHKNNSTFACEVCDKKFALKSALKQHEFVHLDETNYKCEICQKKFQRKSSYTNHLKKHTDCKKYSCPDCYKEFTDKKTLKRHRRIHTAKRRYKCKHCDVTSVRKDNLKRHIQNIHKSDQIERSIEIMINKVNHSDTDSIRCLPFIDDNEMKSSTACSWKEDQPIRLSVITSVGNVNSEKKPTNSCLQKHVDQVVGATNKKLKKKYDPYDIYRKILLDSNDDDSIAESDDSIKNSLVLDKTYSGQSAIEAKRKTNEKPTNFDSSICQSNFSETHWRKNFKYTYQFQHDY